MKKIAILILLFSFYSGISQTLSEKEIAKLNSLEIKTEKLNLENTTIQKDLNEILKLERKRKKNKTIGIVMTTISVSGMILGGALLSKDNGLTDVFGGMMVAGGAVYGGISIPFWVSSKKRKKERDELIKMFNK